MKPTWSNDRCDLYLADARDVLPTIGKVGLLCTDPPYGVAFKSNWAGSDHAEIANDKPEDASIVESVLALAWARLDRDRHGYSFEVPLVPEEEHRARAELVWDKARTSMGDLSLPWAKSYETIHFVHKGSGVKTPAGGLSARMRKGSVIRVPSTGGSTAKRHPTEKPIRLMQQLIESSSLVGDVVLDPFMGVGSTCVAAILLGRRAIGIELDPGYFEIAKERCIFATDLATIADRL